MCAASIIYWILNAIWKTSLNATVTYSRNIRQPLCTSVLLNSRNIENSNTFCSQTDNTNNKNNNNKNKNNTSLPLQVCSRRSLHPQELRPDPPAD